MWIFTPRYLKHARLLHKGVTRFINYKRDILPADKLEQITGLRDHLKQAIKARDAVQIDKLHEQINDACNRALPEAMPSEIADNVEVIFVAIVVALGIRAYIAQPFQIPTASMQPTLNGYRAEPTEQDPVPNIFMRLWHKKDGLSYYNVTSDHTGYLDAQQPFQEHTLVLFTWSSINFADGHKINVWCPLRQLVGPRSGVKDEEIGLGLGEFLQIPTQPVIGPDGREQLTPDAQTRQQFRPGQYFVKEGQLLARGILHAGDHILVNKFAYHFRRPERGEVFVFTTRNIKSPFMNVPKEQGSQHYIKRLVGVPGDKLEVHEPALWVNGKPAEEFGMKRVASKEGPYKGYGSLMFLAEGRQVSLGDAEYWAMGDNSFNSSDSRYWGSVPQRNVVGPALFCYLPFTSHWGVIR